MRRRLQWPLLPNSGFGFPQLFATLLGTALEGADALDARRLGVFLEALEELHRARVDWWSGDTVRGSVLACLISALLYRQLRLFVAAKAYALAAATIAATSGDGDLADLVPRGLLIAANCELLAGAWLAAAGLYEKGLLAQHHLGSGGINFDEDEMIQGAALHLAYISRCARRLDPALQSTIQAIVDRTLSGDVTDEVIDGDDLDSDHEPWQSFGEGELSNPPFSDLGPVRCIRFSALGTDWTVSTANDDDSVRAAERFVAGVQTMLAALAREDLCLIPTAIAVAIEQRREAGAASSNSIEAVPSNDGREWTVQLTVSEASGRAHLEEIDAELLTVLGTILREASLLPSDDLAAIMEQAFQRGLGHVLAPAVQMEQFAETFSNDEDEAFDRQSIEVPWDLHAGVFTAHEELRWQDGPGPTYSSDKATELLRTRYEALAQGLRITAPVLSRSAQFRSVVQSLRAQGWLDWHILTAVANIVINYRYLPDNSTPPSEDTMRELMQAASSPESAAVPPVPVALFSLEQMQNARQHAMMSLVKHWGLECWQRTPDMAAIEQLLAARYGYWDEDVPHEDPFLDDGGATPTGLWTPS